MCQRLSSITTRIKTTGSQSLPWTFSVFVRDYLPLQQGLRPAASLRQGQSSKCQRLSSITTRIKTSSRGTRQSFVSGQRLSSITTRIKTPKLALGSVGHVGQRLSSITTRIKTSRKTPSSCTCRMESETIFHYNKD